MKILYSIQGTGNGHISRAEQLYPYLSRMGEVHFFLSGDNYTLKTSLPIQYKSKGLSLFYKSCGNLSYRTILRKTRPLQIIKDIQDLPVQRYDLIINDFDFITAMACKRKKVRSIQFGHQASFQSSKTPRPDRRSWLGERVLQSFAQATSYVGLHFNAYDDFIFPPIIKKEIQEGHVTNDGHITIYLPSYQEHCLISSLRSIEGQLFHWFLPTVKQVYREGNIVYYPVQQDLFNRSIMSSAGVITGGGFETPSEVLYMEKKLLSIPIQRHYEQQCNSAALKQMGVTVLNEIGTDFENQLRTWLQEPKPLIAMRANSIYETLNYLLDQQYPYKRIEDDGLEMLPWMV